VMTLTSQSDEGFNRPAALRTKMNTTNVWTHIITAYAMWRY
jgi:hypothetical protein